MPASEISITAVSCLVASIAKRCASYAAAPLKVTGICCVPPLLRRKQPQGNRKFCRLSSAAIASHQTHRASACHLQQYCHSSLGSAGRMPHFRISPTSTTRISEVLEEPLPRPRPDQLARTPPRHAEASSTDPIRWCKRWHLVRNYYALGTPHSKQRGKMLNNEPAPHGHPASRTNHAGLSLAAVAHIPP